jgi:hypothetical protein
MVTLNEFLGAAEIGGDAGLTTVQRYIIQNHNRYIVQNGNNVLAINAADQTDGYTALICAAKNGHAAIVTALLAKEGIAINAAERGGYTALMFAARNGHADIVTALLAKEGIAINAADQDGVTALICAAFNGNADIVTALLAKEGIAINAVDQEDGYTALISAAHNGHAAIVTALLGRLSLEELLKENHDHRTAAQEAEQEGHHDIAESITRRISALQAGVASFSLSHSSAVLEEKVAPQQVISVPLTPQERLVRSNFTGEVPVTLTCPIGADGRLMTDPVTVASGKTFERENLKKWCLTQLDPETRTFPCPLTRKPIHERELNNEPTTFVKDAIDAFVITQEKAKKDAQNVMNALAQQVEVSNPVLHIHEDSKSSGKDEEKVRAPDEQYEDVLLPPPAMMHHSQPRHSSYQNDSKHNEDSVDLEQLRMTKQLAEDFLASYNMTFNRASLVDNHQNPVLASSSAPEPINRRQQDIKKRLAFFESQKQLGLANHSSSSEATIRSGTIKR